MHHILSISLGSSSRDKTVETIILGEEFKLERRGTDGDLSRFARFLHQNDGKVDALCLGGTNLGLHWRNRYYPFREIQRVVEPITQTPVVDGAGLKNTLEREAIHRLQAQNLVDLDNSPIFLVCAMDRFGMAEALAEHSRQLVLGDFMFNLGLPTPLHSLRSLDVLAPLLMPVLRRVPFRWLYPTGSKQDEIRPKWERYYQWAEVIAGDFLLIHRHLPDRLEGKVIITNTTTEQDVAELRQRGVHLLITTTPVLDGRSFATNVMEGVFVTLLQRRPEDVEPQEYLDLAQQMGWEPVVRELSLP